jgi:polysaccharide biosynthesis protein PslH
VLPVPFASELPPGPSLPGAPAVSLLVGAGWQPNREGAEAFVAHTWPLVRRALPQARLHLFGDARTPGDDAIVRHPAPDDPATAFAADSILVVPLAVASGVRMKVLEAWARGVPVVATPAAAAGLDATPGRELLVAELGEPFAAAVATLAGDASLRAALVVAGRELLLRRHAPSPLRRRLLAGYAAAAAAPRGW